MLEKAIMTPISTYLTGYETTSISQVMKTGELTITNAEIRPEVVGFLPLPLDLLFGRIDRFSLKIPWAKLSSAPVEVELSGLYLVLTEKDPSQWQFDHPLAVQKRKNRINQLELNLKIQSEKKLMSAEEELKGKSFTDRLTGKILDNLMISIRDIHLRFESGPISLGLVLQSVSCETTNSDWGRQFIDRQIEGKAGDAIYKLGQIIGFGLYLSPDSPNSLSDFPDKPHILHELIYTQPEPTFLITPCTFHTVNIEIKAIHRYTGTDAKVEIIANLDQFRVKIEEKQFKTMVNLLGKVTEYGVEMRKQ